MKVVVVCAAGERAHRRLVRQPRRHRADARGKAARVGRRRLHPRAAEGKGLGHKARGALHGVHRNGTSGAHQGARPKPLRQDARVDLSRHRTTQER